MTGHRLRTVVADTSALVSLAVPRADAAYDTHAVPDPLQCLLTSCDVFVPPEVLTELEGLTQYRGIHGAAATALRARSKRSVRDSTYRFSHPRFSTRPE